MKGSGNLPTKNILQQIAESSYSRTSPKDIGNFTLLHKTDTMVFYVDYTDKTIIVGIRGTRPTDSEDLYADAQIAFGKLKDTDRYKKDEEELRRVQQYQKPSEFDYYGVGHSLSGAILDLLLSKKLLKYAISYNPAVESRFFQTNNNLRIYNSGDPLYLIMGQFTKNHEVRNKNKSIVERIVKKIPYVGTLYNKLSEHQLDSFKGGKKRSLYSPRYGSYDFYKMR
jgi:hypothetical protein